MLTVFVMIHRVLSYDPFKTHSSSQDGHLVGGRRRHVFLRQKDGLSWRKHTHCTRQHLVCRLFFGNAPSHCILYVLLISHLNPLLQQDTLLCVPTSSHEHRKQTWHNLGTSGNEGMVLILSRDENCTESYMRHTGGRGASDTSSDFEKNQDLGVFSQSMHQSINQSINQPINQPSINQSINQSIHKLSNQSINQSSHQLINQSINS